MARVLIGNFKGPKGDTGTSGNGISTIETTASTEDKGANSIAITLTDGTVKNLTILNGSKGAMGDQGIQGVQGVQGEKGEDGTGVSSVVQTTTSTEDNGSNAVTVTLTDGTSSTFYVRNGSKGSQGEKGDKGDTGATGTFDTTDLFQKVYPVGSIYMSTISTSPAQLFGGTWVSLQDRFLIGAGSTYAANATGGEASHALSEAEMPSHSHTRGTMEIAGSFSHRNLSYNELATSGAFSYTDLGSNYITGWNTYSERAQLDFKASSNWTGSTSVEGSGTAHNNLPPYLAVYMWRKVSESVSP